MYRYFDQPWFEKQISVVSNGGGGDASYQKGLMFPSSLVLKVHIEKQLIGNYGL